MDKKLHAILERIREMHQIPSVAVSIHKDGETEFICSGTADFEKNLASTPITIYGIGSASKSFVATAICLLADDGLLKLDDPVKKHLKDFELYDPYMTEHITVRDVLSHRTGMSRHEVVRKNLYGIGMEQLVHQLRYLPPAFEPRTRMHYQNFMYTLGAVLIEKITCGRWQDFVRARIWEPLGMSRTYAYPEEFHEKDKNEAKPYAWQNGKYRQIPLSGFNTSGPAGCISSTSIDMDKWLRLHLNRGVFEGNRIYSEAMADQMHCPQTIIKPNEMYPWSFAEVDFFSYGLGWFLESYRGHKMVHHGGTVNGYKSLIGFFPEDRISFSILSNLDRNQGCNAFGYFLADLLFGLPRIDWCQRFLHETKKNEANISAANEAALDKTKNAPSRTRPTAEYVGEYENAGYGKLKVVAKGEDLFVEVTGDEFRLLSTGYDSFVLDASGPQERNFGTDTIYGAVYLCRFDYDATGRIDKLNILFEPICKQYTVFAKQ